MTADECASHGLLLSCHVRHFCIAGPLHCFANYLLLVQFSPAVGSFAMAAKLAGYLYDKEATAAGEGAERICVGARCYRCGAGPQGTPIP